MTVLVTGATGFIGRRLVRRLLETHGADAIVCLVKAPATPLEAEALESYRARGLRLLEGDLVSQPVCAEPPPRVDAVFHLAANIDTDANEDELLVNHAGTRHLLDWLAPVSRGARILYASSVAVHDRNAPPTAPIDERSPFVPRTLYGKTKLQGETILRERAAVDAYSWTIVRLPTVYGPGQKTGGLFDKMIELASAGALLAAIDWPGRTSIIYVDDVAEVMIDLAGRPEAAGEIFCLASDESLTVGEIARIVGRVVGRTVQPIRIPPFLLRAVRAVVWNRSVAATLPGFARLSFWRLSLIVSDGFWFDTAKFRRVYTRPIRTLEEGLADTIRSTPRS
jgi:Nucleoside-diphosphate-sugar epimerases